MKSTSRKQRHACCVTPEDVAKLDKFKEQILLKGCIPGRFLARRLPFLLAAETIEDALAVSMGHASWDALFESVRASKQRKADMAALEAQKAAAACGAQPLIARRRRNVGMHAYACFYAHQRSCNLRAQGNGGGCGNHKGAGLCLVGRAPRSGTEGGGGMTIQDLTIGQRVRVHSEILRCEVRGDHIHQPGARVCMDLSHAGRSGHHGASH